MNELTRAILLVNAECYTALNARKSVLMHYAGCAACDVVRLLRGELRFLDVVFSKHPKSADAWAHRYDAADSDETRNDQRPRKWGETREKIERREAGDSRHEFPLTENLMLWHYDNVHWRMPRSNARRVQLIGLQEMGAQGNSNACRRERSEQGCSR